MKTCSSCQHLQPDGNFCGDCGAAFSTELSRAAVEIPSPSSNETFQKGKEEAVAFMNFFMQQVKTPSAHIFSTRNRLSHSVMMIVFYLLLTSASIYMTLPVLFKPSLLQTTFYMSTFFILVFVITLLSILSTFKLFSTSHSVAELIRILGGFYAIPVAPSSVSILLTLLDATSFSMIIGVLGVGIAFVLIPLFVVIRVLSLDSKSIEGFNGVLFYVSCTIVGFILLSVFIADTAIGELLSML